MSGLGLTPRGPGAAWCGGNAGTQTGTQTGTRQEPDRFLSNPDKERLEPRAVVLVHGH